VAQGEVVKRQDGTDGSDGDRFGTFHRTMQILPRSLSRSSSHTKGCALVLAKAPTVRTLTVSLPRPQANAGARVCNPWACSYQEP